MLQAGIPLGAADHLPAWRIDMLLAVDGIVKEETRDRSPK